MRRDAPGDYNHQTTQLHVRGRTTCPRCPAGRQKRSCLRRLVRQLGRGWLGGPCTAAHAAAAGRVVVGRRLSRRQPSPAVAQLTKAPVHAPRPLFRARSGNFGSSGGEAGGWVACKKGACGGALALGRDRTEEGKGAAGGGCEASGRVFGAGGARGAAGGVCRSRTERRK